MRRKAGIVIGACAALALVGSASAAAWTYTNDEGRPVGSWHDAPGVAQTPIADERAEAAPADRVARVGKTAPSSPAEKAAPKATARTILPESAQAAAAQGRQKVGELLRVDKLLGYVNAPRTETFHYPRASYVKLHFNRMMMLPGDYLTVSNPDGTESYRYDATTSDKWAMSITGDTAELEMHRVAGDALGVGSLLGTLGVNVDQVARGYTPDEQAKAPEAQLTAPGRTGREESVCGGDESADAVCYKSADPVAYTRSKAIARLLINGTELCTGWRLGSKDRMLTNNHCFTTSADAYETEVWFNYQCAQCGGYEVYKPTKVWGAQVLATDHVYDYTLFTVEDFKSIQKFGYLTFDTTRPAKGQELYIPQHPAGEPTRIAGALGEKAGTCAVANNAYDGYATGSDVAYYCDTEGGSSGSPVISRKTDEVVAMHHFGGCPNSGVRADLLYAKLKSLL
ncbi:MAG TPA: serine protease [Actinoplanes sp.]|nr:serine protease [Actinoplanes sp.]